MICESLVKGDIICIWDFPNLCELNIFNRWHLWDEYFVIPILESAEIDLSNVQEIRQLLHEIEP